VTEICSFANNRRRTIDGTFAFFFSMVETSNEMHEDDPSARKQLARFKEEGQ